METKKIIKTLRNCVDYPGGCQYCNVGYMTNGNGKKLCHYDVVKQAADRLEELEDINEKWCEIEESNKARFSKKDKEISNLKKQLSEKQPEWISVEDGKEMPDAISYTVIRHDQFPRLVIVTDENRIVTHWMMLDAPKPKEPTFKDVFLKAFPKAETNDKGVPKACRALIFGSGKCNHNVCSECWNQPYFEEEGEQE